MEPLRYDDQNRRLCSAHTQAGNSCRAPAVNGSRNCINHGSAQGTPGREAADSLVLSELIGPALMRLKELVESKDTPPAVLLPAIKLILDMSGYDEVRPITIGMLEREISRLEAEGFLDDPE
jgi:hypothetical protein